MRTALIGSNRITAALELAGAVLLTAAYLRWGYNAYSIWPHLMAYSLFLALIVFAKQRRGETFRSLGLRWDNFFSAARWLFPVTVAGIGLISLIWTPFFPVHPGFYREPKFWFSLSTYPFWGLLQQYIALAFFFRRFKELFAPHPWPAVLSSATVFAAIHLPNPPLTLLCFAGGLVWAWVYHHRPNLIAIAISHGIFGAVCAQFLMMYMNVGPAADVGRWSKVKPVLYAVDTINGRRIRGDHPLITVDAKTDSITVTGWAASQRHSIEDIVICFGNREYPAQRGLKRPDVANVYGNKDFSTSGFTARIPVSQWQAGTYLLTLKILLRDKLFSHDPGKRIWVRIEPKVTAH